MHILDVWLNELTFFYPKNLKKILWELPKQLHALFKFLFIDWWWLSFFLLFTNFAIYGTYFVTQMPEILYIVKLLVFAAQAYFSSLITLYTFPSHSYKSADYIQRSQSLVWPIVTPFVLWIYFNWHVYKFLYLLMGYDLVHKIVTYTSYALLIEISWFTSPFFVFFAFTIISTYVAYGVWYALEHAVALLWYTYPLCVVMFGVFYGTAKLLEFALRFLNLGGIINPIALLIPLAVILFSMVYQWHMQLEEDWE